MTTTLLQQALQALETCTPGDYSTGHVIHPWHDDALIDAAADAIRAHLAQPQPTDADIDAIAERMASTLSASGGLRAFAHAVLAAQPAPVPAEQIDDIIRDVAELDYNSPEGMPDVMLVTADELRAILQNRIAQPAPVPQCSPTLTECPRCKNDIKQCPLAAPVPVPLTAIQILGGLMDAGVPDKFFHAFTAGARFAERKHGIAIHGSQP